LMHLPETTLDACDDGLAVLSLSTHLICCCRFSFCSVISSIFRRCMPITKAVRQTAANGGQKFESFIRDMSDGNEGILRAVGDFVFLAIRAFNSRREILDFFLHFKPVDSPVRLWQGGRPPVMHQPRRRSNSDVNTLA